MNREPADNRHMEEHFIEFAIDFFNLAKDSYYQQNQTRANPAVFQVLMQLDQSDRQAPTMPEMVLQLDITKQQLTKFINDLEEKNLVHKQCSSRNRCHVYLMITPEGASIMKQLREAMLECTVSRFSSYNQEELAELDDCLIRLSTLLEKFAAVEDIASCGDFPELQGMGERYADARGDSRSREMGMQGKRQSFPQWERLRRKEQENPGITKITPDF